MANRLFIGDEIPEFIYIGDSPVDEVYVGDELVWQVAPPREFIFNDAGIEFSVSDEGLVTLTIEQGSIATSTFTNGQELGRVSVDTLRTNSITVNVPVSSQWTNSGETVTGSIEVTQSGSGTFTIDDVVVTCSVDSSGNITINTNYGVARLRTEDGQVTSYGVVTSATNRSILVEVSGTVTSEFSNSGDSYAFDFTCPAVQPLFVLPNFAVGNLTIGCSVNGQDGSISLSVSHGSIGLAPGQISSFPTVSTPTVRTISVRATGTVPVGFANTGDSYSFTTNCVTTQPAFQLAAFGQSDWTGSISVSPLGQVLVNSGNGNSIRISPLSFPSNTTNNDISRTIQVTLEVPTGYSNSGNDISFSVTVLQPSNLPVFTVNDWSGTAIVNSAGVVLVQAGNANPLDSYSPLTFPVVQANTTRVISVTVTIPSGFRNFGSLVTFNVATTQPPEAAPQFTTTVNITGAVSNATIGSSSVTLTGNQNTGDTATFSISPNTGFEFTSVGNVNISSSNNTLASALVAFDGFGLGTLVVTVSGTIGTSNQTVTLFVSGAAVSTGPAQICTSVTFTATGPTSIYRRQLCGTDSSSVNFLPSGTSVTECVVDGEYELLSDTSAAEGGSCSV